MIIYLSQAELLVGKDWRKAGGFFVCFVAVNIQDGCIIQSTQLSGTQGRVYCLILGTVRSNVLQRAQENNKQNLFLCRKCLCRVFMIALTD